MKKIFYLLGAVIVLLGTPSLKAQNTFNNDTRIMIIGASDVGSTNLSYLAGVKGEVDSISSLFPRENVLLLEGPQARIENLKQSFDFHPTILHIAGNGFPYPIGKDSSIPVKDFVIPLYAQSDRPMQTTDSLSTIERVTDKSTNLFISDFKQFFPEGIDLVVLSTSNSYNDAVIGFLQDAGVKSCLLTTSGVNDMATQLLMTEFYKNLIQGQDKFQALSNAQKTLREFSGMIGDRYLEFSDPRYWAAFILLDALN